MSESPDHGANTGQQQSVAPPGVGTFGFEFELLIPLTEGGTYTEINSPSTPRHIVGEHTNLGFTLKWDQSSALNYYIPQGYVQLVQFRKNLVKVAWTTENMSIAEVVTGVFNTALSEQDVRGRITNMAGWATELHGRVKNDRIPITDTGITAAQAATKPSYFGPIQHPKEAPPSTGSLKPPELTAAASIHQTYGLPLCRVAEEFTFLCDQAEKAGQTYPWIRSMRLAAWKDEGSNVGNALTMSGAADKPDKEREDLRGFYALVWYYISARRQASANYLAKNHNALLLYYKTDLGNVRNTVCKKYGWVANALDDNATRESVLAALGPPATLRDWTLSVLKGERDTFFWDTKNEFSDELSTHPDGPLAIVVENRRLREVQPPQGAAPGQLGARYQPKEWADLAVELYSRLRRYWPA